MSIPFADKKLVNDAAFLISDLHAQIIHGWYVLDQTLRVL